MRGRCYGGVIRVYNEMKSEYEYAVVKGRCTQKWSFPKGHGQKEEDPLVCAKREIYEETGIELEREAIHRMQLKGGVYYVFELEEKIELEPMDQLEIDDQRWVTVEEMSELYGNSGIRSFVEKERRKETPKDPKDPQRT